MFSVTRASRGISQVVRMNKQLEQATAGLKTMDLSGHPIFEEVKSRPEVEKLVSIFDKYGYELRLAGGPVRDLLSDKTPTDLDFATIATPTEMKAMFEKEEIRMINEMGEKHGTITARIDDKDNFECTTLRIDKVTDGRRAEVEFTDDWRLDANRRDLTINSMFLDTQGTLYDYFNGAEDLKARKVRFVGSTVTRVCEDYLRIMRYFRFYGRIATCPDNHDPDIIEDIRKHAEGLNIVSGERIWMELKKTLSGNYAGNLALTMCNEAKISKFIGLPEDVNTEEISKIWERSQESKIKIHPAALLAALVRNDKEWMDLLARLKFSRYDRELGLFVIKFRDREETDTNLLNLMKYEVVDAKENKNNIRDFGVETLKYRNQPELAETLNQWSIPPIPLGGGDLILAGVPRGKLVSVVHKEMLQKWKLSDFKLTKEELLGDLENVMESIDLTQFDQPKKRKKSK